MRLHDDVNRPALRGLQVDPQSFLAEHFDLPPLPEVASKVLARLRSGQAQAGDIADLLAVDPGLVAQVLKIVNSAYYGLPRRISEVRHAVAYLGLAEVERLILTATVMKEFSGPRCDELHRFWFHSFYSSLISKLLCKRYAKSMDPEELHTAVLLHDVGKLVYMKFFDEHYVELARHCRTQGDLLIDAERHFDYPSHLLLGSLLCDRWRLPDSIKRACEQHELEHLERLDLADPFAEEVRLFCLANLLSNLAHEELSREKKSAIQTATIRALDCTSEGFLLLMAEVYELKSEVERFLRQL